MNIGPKTWKNCQRIFIILPKNKCPFKCFPKMFKSWPKWRNFAKSRQTEFISVQFIFVKMLSVLKIHFELKPKSHIYIWMGKGSVRWDDITWLGDHYRNGSGLFFVYFRSFSFSSVFFFFRSSSFIFGLFETKINTIFTVNKCEKMTIQYTVLGFEPTTFILRVSSHNH